jgi:hypothetical protein
VPIEPESDYVEVRPLLYDYGLVFECVTESVQDEGFHVATADRELGLIETNTIPGREDRLARVQAGTRIRATVLRRAPKDFVVRMTATQLERDLGATPDGMGDWRYKGRDDDVLERLRKRFDTRVEARYRPPPDKG